MYYCDVLSVYIIYIMSINLQLTWGIWSGHVVSRKHCLAKLAIQMGCTGHEERHKVKGLTHAHMTDVCQSQKMDNKFTVLASYTWQTGYAIYGS